MKSVNLGLVKYVSSLLAVFGILCSAAAHANVIADSVADFSASQGNNGWYYGYSSGDYLTYNGELTLFNDYVSSAYFDTSVGSGYHAKWENSGGGLWTQLWADGGHPNATNSNDVSQVAVRRWVSNVNGNVLLDGVLADMHWGTGDGVGGAIYVDGNRIWDALIADGGNTTFSLAVALQSGSNIDFVLGANQNDYTDSSLFTAQISSPSAVPLPAALPLMLSGLGVLGFATHRRKETV